MVKVLSAVLTDGLAAVEAASCGRSASKKPLPGIAVNGPLGPDFSYRLED